MHKQFWLVCSEDGSGVSRPRGSQEVAQEEAERLARQAPGTTFFIMQTVNACRVEPELKWRTLVPA